VIVSGGPFPTGGEVVNTSLQGTLFMIDAIIVKDGVLTVPYVIKTMGTMEIYR
jgi:hypothetical protein